MLFFLLTLSAFSRNLPDVTAVDPQVQARAQSLASGLQGAFLVGRDGRVLAASGMGKANRVTGEENTIHTSLRLASVSKPIAATALMQLVERGLLDVEDPLDRHLPDYGDNGRRLKVRHLLTHSSGIPDYLSLVTNPSGPQEILDSFRLRPLAFTPGSRVSYSNSNFAVVGYLIEKLTGKPYETYLRENVFRRAWMLHSGYAFPKKPGPGFGAPSGGNPDGPWEPNGKAYAAGALYSSVADMAYFNHALMNGWLLDSETVKKMHRPQVGSSGFGFFVDGEYVGHDGSIAGFTSQLYLHPPTQGIVIVLSNGGAGASSVARKLRGLL